MNFNGATILSIVIPAYNEERRLPQTVIETMNWGHDNIIQTELWRLRKALQICG